jgi:hypothetical protein
MESYKGLLENVPCPGHKSVLEGQDKVENEPHVGRHCFSKTDDIVERVRSLVNRSLIDVENDQQ